MTPGDHRVTVAFHEEPKSFRSVCKSQGMLNAEHLSATFRVVTICFGPLNPELRQSFCGYLSRIVGFEICARDSTLCPEDTVRETWGQVEDELQRAIAVRFLSPA